MLPALRRPFAATAQSSCRDGGVSPIVQAVLSEYRSTRLFRLDLLRRIDPRTADAQLNRQWRHCYERLWRADADLQHNNRPVRIKRSGEWSTAEWIAYGGPKHLRMMAKEWRLLDLAGKGVMPYETEASEHLRVSYGPSCHVGCGTVLLPEQVLTPPTVQFELSKEEQRHISLLMIDVDSELCLSGLQDPEHAQTVCDYWPPHPGRGTGHHRILFCLLAHRDSLVELERTRYSHLLAANAIIGYSFFRTCWTRTVLSILASHKDMPDGSRAEVFRLPPLGPNPRLAERLLKQQHVRQSE